MYYTPNIAKHTVQKINLLINLWIYRFVKELIMSKEIYHNREGSLRRQKPSNNRSLVLMKHELSHTDSFGSKWIPDVPCSYCCFLLNELLLSISKYIFHAIAYKTQLSILGSRRIRMFGYTIDKTKQKAMF